MTGDGPGAVQASFDALTADGVDVDALPSVDGYDFRDPIDAKLYVILRDHRGHDNPITAERLCDMVGLDDGEAHPKTRRHITQVIAAGVAVASCDRGFFITESESEADQYERSLIGRVDETVKRVHMYHDAVVDADHIDTSPEFEAGVDMEASR